MPGKLAQIFAGTSNGVYRVTVPEGEVAFVGLAGHYVNHLHYHRARLLAATPVLGQLHKTMGNVDIGTHPEHVPGRCPMLCPPPPHAPLRSCCPLPGSLFYGGRSFTGNSSSSRHLDQPGWASAALQSRPRLGVCALVLSQPNALYTQTLPAARRASDHCPPKMPSN